MSIARRSTEWNADPHAATPIRSAGPAPAAAAATLVLLHGRGATAENILELYAELNLPALAALAPQAASGTWYPQSFLAPIESNQPWLDSAMGRVEAIVHQLLSMGLPSQRIALMGFSQGACLACEFVAQHPRQYGALIAFTGGLIGPAAAQRDYEGSLQGTPVFLGSGDPDPHVPIERVLETQDAFERMGAKVELRRYPGLPHTVNDDELQAARMYLARLAAPPEAGA